MKSRILTSLCVALVANCVSVRADDTPAQAAARAALERQFQKLNQSSGNSRNTNSVTASFQSAKSATNIAAPNTNEVPVVQGEKVAAAANKSSVPAPAIAPASPPLAEKESAQAAALAALEQKMNQMNAAATGPPAKMNSLAVPTTPPSAPVREASAAAIPVIELPAAETPPAQTPAISSAAAAPASAVPAVVAPVPKVSAAPVVTAPSVAVVPPAIPGPIALPATTPEAAMPAEPMLPSSSPGRPRPVNELVTITGKIYKNVEVERVEDDGIVISYTPAHGGWATAKVPFEDLPGQLRQQYKKP